MRRYLGIDRQEIFLAPSIGYGTVLATGLTLAFIVGATDGHQGSIANGLGNGLAAVAIGLPVILVFAFGIAIVLSVPATFVWTGTSSVLRKLGYSSRVSALIAMAVTTILTSIGLLVYDGGYSSTLIALTYLVVPLVVSVATSFWAFKGQKTELAVAEK